MRPEHFARRTLLFLAPSCRNTVDRHDHGDDHRRQRRGLAPQAILDSNASVATLDTIAFAIPGAGPHTIAVASSLPGINDPVVIDGTTQPGYAGSPLIEIDGTRAGAFQHGLTINAGGSTVRGLADQSLQRLRHPALHRRGEHDRGQLPRHRRRRHGRPAERIRRQLERFRRQPHRGQPHLGQLNHRDLALRARGTSSAATSSERT